MEDVHAIEAFTVETLMVEAVSAFFFPLHSPVFHVVDDLHA